ncbi:phosphate signaling complex protein PhoU [Magnetospira thiophila]
MQGHTVRSYEREFDQLRAMVAEMSAVVSEELAQALEALKARDGATAQKLLGQDEAANELERQIDEAAIRMIALRHPMATDLREIIAALRLATDLERIGDYAKNIAKHTISIAPRDGDAPQIEALLQMGALVARMVPDAVKSFLDRDSILAQDVRQRDEEVDTRHTEIFRDLLTGIDDRTLDATTGTHLMFVGRCLERLGDHATNIADHALYLVAGSIPPDDRIKADQAAYVVVR